MKSTNRIIAGVVVIAVILLLQNPVLAQEKAGHSHEKSETHGGEVLMSKQHHFEAVWTVDAIDVYLYDGVQKPLAAKGVEGTVTLKFKDGKIKVLPLQYVSDHKEGEHEAMEEHHEKVEHHEEKEHEHGDEKEHGKAKGAMQMDRLQAKVDLSKIEAGSLKAIFELKKLASKEESSAKFTATFNGLSDKKASHDHDEGQKH